MVEGGTFWEIMERKPTLTKDADIESILEKTIATLEKGGTILYPSDTIWGLGCDATQADAVERIFKIKDRPSDKPFILLMADLEMATEYVGAYHPKLDRLLQYHDRPLTIVFQRCQNLPSISHGPDGSVAVRIVKDEFCRRLIDKLGKPLVSTSANKNGSPFPQHFGEIGSDIISAVDYVTPYRQQEASPTEPSVIVTLSKKDELVFLRN